MKRYLMYKSIMKYLTDKDLSLNAKDLDRDSADPKTYNCYGNAINKQIVSNPSGYQEGDSTAKTFEAVKKDIDENNIRRLSSINGPINDDENLVALKCGEKDFHFM